MLEKNKVLHFEVQVQRQTSYVDMLLAACRAILMQIINVELEELLVRQVHAHAVLVLAP